MNKQLFELTPEAFKPHALHSSDKNFRETNCYADLIIEIVNCLGLNPIPCLAYTLGGDFEGDQWTFGKPSHDDLFNLYGIQIEELSLYRTLVDQMTTQVNLGKVPMIEADAYYLPDTEGIDYRQNHVKTTIGITHIDITTKKMFYFHNDVLAKLEGEDFDQILQPPASLLEAYLSPYCELLKLKNLKKIDEKELRIIALINAAKHFRKRANTNPIIAYQSAIATHQMQIIQGGQAAYHAYTFVAPRQMGASHELGSAFLSWLSQDHQDLAVAANAFEAIAGLSKSLVLKLARVAHSGKPANLEGIFTDIAHQWEIADHALHHVLDPIG
jgi:hypothetical protein